MKIAELLIHTAKKDPPQPVQSLTLIAGVGADGDCHNGGDRQISLWDAHAKAQTRELGYPGLCMRRFSANIIIEGLKEAHWQPGDTLLCGTAAIRITQAGKPCYPEDCNFDRKKTACPLQCCLYGVVEAGGTLTLGAAASRKSCIGDPA